MLVTLDLSTTQEYSCKNDTAEPKTIFELGIFDSFVAMRIQHLMAVKTKQVSQSYETDITDLVFEAVRYGLRGVKNCKIPFETEEVSVPNVGKRTVVSAEFLKQLNPECLVELYGELLNVNFVSEADKKK